MSSFWPAAVVCTVAKCSPCHPKVEGSSPAPTAGTAVVVPVPVNPQTLDH